MGCSCHNIPMGSYADQIALEIPQFGYTMSAYILIQERRGLCTEGLFISIDACIAVEILSLWLLGIRTTGGCCGHKIAPGYIGVVPEDIVKMKGLGYTVKHNEIRLGAEDSFIPRYAVPV